MPSFIQSAAWERFQRSAGASVRRVQSQLFIERSFSFGTYWIASRCEIKPGLETDSFGGATFLRFEPEDEQSLENLRELGTPIPTVAVQPRQTSLVDIRGTSEEIIAGYKQKHRYNLKVALRSGVITETYSTELLAHFPRFWKLMQETAERQDFRTHGQEYYREMLEGLEKDGMAHLVFASKDGQDLAALILITYEATATYLHGASTQRRKEAMAPYALHQAAIELAKSLGCSTYDLWGTDAMLDEEKQEWVAKAGSASAGTTRFKLGFGGHIVNYPGCYDVVLRPFWYTLYKIIRAFRSRKRAFS